jgi:toxin ParE1/3/4
LASYRLSAAARTDIIDILACTHEHFGERARLRYERLIVTALHEIATDPEIVGSISRPELGKDVRS